MDSRNWKGAALLGLIAISLGAAPAPTTYIGVENRIQAIRAEWAKPEVGAPPSAPGWNAFFDAITGELQAYRQAPNHTEKMRSLGHIYRIWLTLRTVSWQPAQQVAAELEAWLKPRTALSQADQAFFTYLNQLPAAQDKWTTYGLALRDALNKFEAANTVQDRLVAQRRLDGGLDSLRQFLPTTRWQPAHQMETALRDLIDHPNLDATADVATIGPVIGARDLVVPEVLFFRGQTSYITPGPKAGYGLLPSDQAIVFYSSQYSNSVTPIQGFQEQIASDQRGRRAANLYQFAATTYNQTLATIQIQITPNGIFLVPATQTAVDAAFGAQPIPGLGRHVTRSVAGLVGFNRDRILSEIRENAMPQIRAETASGAVELSQIRSGENQAQLNAQLSPYLLGNQTIGFSDFLFSRVSMSSRPEYARAAGMVGWRGEVEQAGAPFAKPLHLQTVPQGIGVDIHLGSALGNLLAGYYQTPAIQEVQSLAVTIDPPAEAGGQPNVTVDRNLDFPAYLEAVKASRATPGKAVIRVQRPAKPPEFSADANGRLVLTARDVTLDLPAPEQATRGGGLLGAPSEVFRIVAPTAEVVVSFQVTTDPATGASRITGKIDEFNLPPDTQVLAIGADEASARPLNLLAKAGIIGTLSTQIAGRPIDVPLQTDRLSGLQLESVSPLDPTGWLRVQLRTTGAPLRLAAGN